MAAEVQRPAPPPPAPPKEKKPGELPSMKDAIVWAEILGKPKALRRR
ncbi:MAG: hypothetical protein IKO91_07380 [Oscillospiraceae bacterium]|nr:hypothetical protein [Oscillospiraceae bacterium]